MITVQPYQQHIYNKPAFKGRLSMNSSLERFVNQTPELRSELDRLASQASGDLKVIARRVEDGLINGTNAEIFVRDGNGEKRVGILEIYDLPHTIGEFSTKFHK